MRVYRNLSRIWPTSFAAKVTGVAIAALSVPVLCVALGAMLWGADAPTLVAILIGATLATAVAISIIVPALLAPITLIHNAAKSWMSDKVIDALPDGYRDEVGDIMRRINLMAQDADRQRAHQTRQADTDPLTGLLNRRGFSRLMRGTDPGALMLMDLDHFKAVNDCFGHLIGDRVLCHVADTATEVLRNDDLLARWGGEEFVIYLPKATLTQAEAIAERLRKEIAFEPDEVGPEVTISIGLAAHIGGEGFDAAFVAADRALYRAKLQGRNQVCHAVPKIAA